MTQSITPEVIAEIRARHEACENETEYGWIELHGAQAHADRATLLLALTEAQERAERAEEALRPFAKEAEARNWIRPEALEYLIGGSSLTNADLIRAYDVLRAALKETGQ